MRSKSFNPNSDALQRALRFLGYRPRSRAEIMRDLAQHGYSSAVIQRTVGKLCALNYLNDEEFARNWALSRAQNQGFGPKRISQELKNKGVDPPVIEAAVRAAFAPDTEAKKARIVLTKRFRQETLTDPKVLRRAAAFLERKGYNAQIIFDLLKHPVADD